MSHKNWFEQGGSAYARFRPEYPAGLAAYLASVAPDAQLAADVGCGNGQLTRLLAPHFAQVVGLDPSADQIANAVADARIDYRCASAERLPLDDHSVSLIAVAQAAHWFDLPAFYREAGRVGKPGAVLALISYGVLQPEPPLRERFRRFYDAEIGPYWPPERKLVDTGYSTIDFPFDEFQPPAFEIRVEWDLPQLLGYIQTWSAFRSAREAGQQTLLTTFADDAARIWGPPETRRAVSWPIHMRIGRVITPA